MRPWGSEGGVGLRPPSVLHRHRRPPRRKGRGGMYGGCGRSCGRSQDIQTPYGTQGATRPRDGCGSWHRERWTAMGSGTPRTARQGLGLWIDRCRALQRAPAERAGEHTSYDQRVGSASAREGASPSAESTRISGATSLSRHRVRSMSPSCRRARANLKRALGEDGEEQSRETDRPRAEASAPSARKEGAVDRAGSSSCMIMA